MGSALTTIISITGIGGSAYVACLSERYPTRRRHLDTLAGVLLIAGLGLVGASHVAIS